MTTPDTRIVSPAATREEDVSRLDQKLQFFVNHHPDHTPEELPSGPMALLH